MNKPLRVIQIVPRISNEASGPAYSVVRLSESLIAEGQDVTLGALDWAPMKSPPPFLMPFPLGLGPRRLGRSPAMHHWLTQFAQIGEISLIHNHSLYMMANVYPGWVARQTDTPLIVSPRGTFSDWIMAHGSPIKRFFFWPFVQRPALKATTCFHATADSEYEDIRRLGYKQPVAVIPNGIDIPERKPKQKSAWRTLLFLGRIHPKKGLDMLLPAWRVVQNRFPDWQLKVVGPDNVGYLRKMQQLAMELKLERILFTGALFGEAKWQAYRDADLFVLPTYSENFGNAVAESLAAGTPAIVSRGAPWQGLETHCAGWWIDIGVDALVACLEHALKESSNTLEVMGSRGRDWIDAEFSWRRVGKEMAQTYRWVLDGGTPPKWIKLG